MRLLASALIAVVLAACGPEAKRVPVLPVEAEAGMVTVTINATVPDDAGEIYLAANIDALGPWRADGQLMTGEGQDRTTTLALIHGFALEFKLTGGSWDTEGTGPSGTVLPNFSHTVDARGNNVVEVEIVDFKWPADAYIADVDGSGVLGTLIYWTDVESQFFDVTRHVSVWLPLGYDADPERHYPVIYMHDGQNLFDPRIANTGTDWGVDEAMMRNVEAGLHDPAIVVGIWSTNIRGFELSPWHGGASYAAMIIEEIMPRVNAQFRTLTGSEHTFTMGSSMGGLISQYLVRSHSDVFSACGCVSTHVPLSPAQAEGFLGLDPGDYADPERPYLLVAADQDTPIPDQIRLYFDYGDITLDETYPPIHDALRPWLESQGLVEGERYAMRRFEGAPHNEAAWRERVHLQLAWLLGGHDPNGME